VLGVALGEGCVEGLGVGVGLGDGLATVGGVVGCGPRSRLAPTATTEPIDPIAIATTSSSAAPCARTANGRPGPNVAAHALRSMARKPTPADGRGSGSVAITAMTRSSKPGLGKTEPLSA
jgi:hypothetical protein